MADDNSQNANQQNSEQNNQAGAGGGAGSRVMNFMQSNKIEAGLWLTRLFTIFSSIFFLIPILGGNMNSLYQRALISNAATSALRLHQRLPNFQLNREFFAMLMMEDSAHYLFYSLIFVMGHPVTMSLIPVFLFAILHSGNYTTKILDQIGPGSLAMIRNLLGKLNTNQRSILRFIACNEIFMMPAIIIMMFSGYASLLLPFIYYRFLTLRYSSRRNPYCRQLFYELRATTEHLCNQPSCPQFIRNVCYKSISFISRLAPPVPPAQ